MPMATKDIRQWREEERASRSHLTDFQKRQIVKLAKDQEAEPTAVRTRNAPPHWRSPLGVRRFMQQQLFVLIFSVMHGLFSLYIRFRQAWNLVRYQLSSVLYYHHGTPEYIQRDVNKLSKIPKHLSVILKAEENRKPKADLDRLIDEAAEVATWCSCANIPVVSVYEKSGTLKKHMPRIYAATIQKLQFYFGDEYPGLAITSPHRDSHWSPNYDPDLPHLKMHLISSEDGRDSMVDLTRTLTEMSQKGKLSPRDISLELIDAELSEGIMSEPDLLISFGPHLDLSGYPPWQIRLTEVFCLRDNEVFGYQVFIKALRKFAGAQFRLGK